MRDCWRVAAKRYGITGSNNVLMDKPRSATPNQRARNPTSLRQRSNTAAAIRFTTGKDRRQHKPKVTGPIASAASSSYQQLQTLPSSKAVKSYENVSNHQASGEDAGRMNNQQARRRTRINLQRISGKPGKHNRASQTAFAKQQQGWKRAPTLMLHGQRLAPVALVPAHE